MFAQMFAYDFMINAFAAGGIVAVTAGIVGFFLILRGQAFAGHALSHVGFAGATGAVLLGLPPLAGLITLTLLAGLLMGALAERLNGRDVAIGMVLAMSLGLGVLFLHFYTSFATSANAVLFGNVFAVTRETLLALALIALLCLAALALISRPLLFVSLQSEMAEAKGVSPRRLGILFLLIVALAVAAAAQIVGVLLVFTLLIAPPAAASLLASRLPSIIALAAGLALIEAWGGIALAFYTDWPSSFWITALAGAIYCAAALLAWRRRSTPSVAAPARTG